MTHLLQQGHTSQTIPPTGDQLKNQTYEPIERPFCSNHHQTQGKNLKQKPQRNAAYCLVSPGLLSYISYTAQAYLPRSVPTHSGLIPPPLITNKNAPEANVIEENFQSSFPLPSMSGWQPKVPITEN